MSSTKHFPLSGTAGDCLFQRQLDDYSCGPACLTTVARIYGSPSNYTDIRTLLAPDPDTGTPQAILAAVAATLVPQQAVGAYRYEGGIAIANIMQEGEGHYVVFLAHEGGNVLYYDPYYHELVLTEFDSIVWDDGNWEPGSVRDTHWTANYAPLPDNNFPKWLATAEPTPPPPAKLSRPQPRP